MRGVPRPARVAGVRRVSHSYWWLTIELVEGVLDSSPGQFVMVWIPRVEEVPMSIAYVEPNRKRFSIFFKVVGRGTRSMSQLHPGSAIAVKGPLGKGILDRIRGENPLLVGGGTGLAPLIYTYHALASMGRRPVVVWGTPKGSDARAVESFLRSAMGMDVHVASDDCTYGFCGTAVDLAMRILKERTPSDVIAAGPKPMLRSLGRKLLAKGMDPLMLLESEVRCGIGMCGSCVIRGTPYLLCIDGPGFRYSEVVKHLEDS